jgi:hypothetical protein
MNYRVKYQKGLESGILIVQASNENEALRQVRKEMMSNREDWRGSQFYTLQVLDSPDDRDDLDAWSYDHDKAPPWYLERGETE